MFAGVFSFFFFREKKVLTTRALLGVKALKRNTLFTHNEKPNNSVKFNRQHEVTMTTEN